MLGSYITGVILPAPAHTPEHTAASAPASSQPSRNIDFHYLLPAPSIHLIAMSASSLLESLATWKDNLVRNSTASVTNTKPQNWIRLVVIVGAYLLIRPYLMKFGERMQEKQHERDAAAAAGTGADIHPNELRTGKKFAIPGVSESDDEEETEIRPGDWGKKARVRQRKFIRHTMEKEEQRLLDEQEEEDLKEILDLLQD